MIEKERLSKHSFKFQEAFKLGNKVGHRAVICLPKSDIALSREVDAIPVGYL